MATKAAHKRLTREYAMLSENPPPFISAHPTESNILEWHYVLTGPPDTPYNNGQYWGTLVFPSDYPFAPPAIRMHTPSGRFRCSERLCLSISDFHPKSFNPSWSVATILLGVQSFMTSEEMTTGSVSAPESERRALALRSRWWNSTGGGTTKRTIPGVQTQSSNSKGFGAIKAGDGGKRFKEEWPELDEENWKFMEKYHIDPQTGKCTIVDTNSATATLARTNRAGASTGFAAVVDGGRGVGIVGHGWIRRNWLYIFAGGLFAYVLLARLLSTQT